MQRVVAPDEVITSPPTAESTGLEHLLPRVKDCDEMGVQSPQVKIPTKKRIKDVQLSLMKRTPQVILNKKRHFRNFFYLRKITIFVFDAVSWSCNVVHISFENLYCVVHISLIVNDLFLSSDVIVERDRLLESGETQSDL